MNLRAPRPTIALLVSAALLVSGASFADVDDTIEQAGDVLDGERDKTTIFDRLRVPGLRVRFDGNAIPDGDFGSADVTSIRTGGALELQIPATKRLALRTSFRGGVTFYDFEGNDRFLDAGHGPGDPFDDLIESVFHVGGRYVLNQTWALLGSTFLTSRFEDGASFGDGLESGGLVAASYNWRGRVIVLSGVGIGSRMTKSGVKISPVIQALWKINDRLKLETEGLRLRLTDKVSDSFSWSLFGGVEGKRYRLDDREDGPGGVGKGSIRDRRAPVGVGFHWRPSRSWRIRAELGSVLYQQFKIGDEDGDDFDTETLDDPAFYGSLRVEYRFGR